MTKDKSTIQATQSVEEAFDAIIRADLAYINHWAPAAFSGEDVEGVHQMRVGLRRMRSALTLFSPAIPRRNTKFLAKEMRWAAKQLDRARDLDVYIADNLSPKKIKNSKQKRLLRKVVIKHRRKAYKQVRRFLKGSRFSSFKDKLIHWCNKKRWRQGLSKVEKENLSREITYFSNQVLENHRCRVLNMGQDIRQMDADALHRLRIECKKLRYATEFFSPLYGTKMTPFLKQLKQLQDVLGLIHDCFVMAGLQNSFLKGKKSEKLIRLADKLVSQRNKSAADLRGVMIGAWENFRTARLPWIE